MGVGELFLNALNQDEPAHCAADRTSEICPLFPREPFQMAMLNSALEHQDTSPSVTLAAIPSSPYLLAV